MSPTIENGRRVLLVRHGQSECNTGKASPGLGKSGLSELGHTQAKALGEAIECAPDLVVISSFQRTVETAAPLLARFPGTKVEEWPVQEITILPTTLFCGTTEAQRGGPSREYFELCQPEHRTGEGAETFREFIGRVDALFSCLRAREESTIVVVTHGNFIQAALWRLLHPDAPVDTRLMRGFREWRSLYHVPNVHIFPLQISSDGEIWLGTSWNPLTRSKRTSGEEGGGDY